MIQPQWSAYTEQINLLHVAFEKICQEPSDCLQALRVCELKNIHVETAQISSIISNTQCQSKSESPFNREKLEKSENTYAEVKK